MRATKRTLTPESEESDSDDDDGRTSPSSKKVRLETGRSNGGKRRRKAGRLAELMKMPVDIFFEIISHLMPMDLLNLARADRFLRSLLMVKRAAPAWRRAISSMDKLPPCPDDMCEPAYTALIFETDCQECGSLGPYEPDYHIRRRYCSSCYKDCTVDYRDYKSKLMLLAWDYVPNTNYRSTQTELLEMIEAYDAVKNDSKARKVFLAERKTKFEAIKLHASELKEWVSHCKLLKGMEMYEIAVRQQASILEKLVEEGWDKCDISIIPVWSDDPPASFRHLLAHKDLTPRVWRHLKRYLLPVLEDYRDRRLAREKKHSRKLRCHEITVLMKKLAGESQDRGDHGPTFSPTNWAWTFPVGDDLFSLPSIAPLLEDYGTPVTEEIFRLHEAAILAETKIYQMRIRRFLAATLDVATGVSSRSWTMEEIFAVPTETLRADDERNIAILSDPTVFFDAESMNSFTSVWNYPHVLRYHIQTMSGTESILAEISPNMEAISIAKALIASTDTFADFEQTVSGFDAEADDDLRFVCYSCPVALQRHYKTWQSLVTHFLREKKWYASESERHEKLFPEAQYPRVKDDHADLECDQLNGYREIYRHENDIQEALREVIDLMNGEPKSTWICKLCSSGKSEWRKKVVWKAVMIIHLETKHSLCDGDAVENMEREQYCEDSWWPSTREGVPIEEVNYRAQVDAEYGCPCDDCEEPGMSDGDSDEPDSYW